MRLLALGLTLLTLAAAPAPAGPIHTSADINAIATLSGPATRDATVYSNLNHAGGYYDLSVPSGAANAIRDDYVSTVTAGTFTLPQFKFTGGSDVVDGVLWFNYYDAAGTYIDHVGAILPAAGVHTWTITLQTPKTNVPRAGFWEMEADSSGAGNCNGTWSASTDAPTVGSTADAAPGYNDPFGTPLNCKFEFIPEPATLALLALGGLLILRRR